MFASVQREVKAYESAVHDAVLRALQDKVKVRLGRLLLYVCCV